MKDLVKTLAEMECVAGSLYADAAEYFNARPELSAFLRDLEQDEIIHYDLMNRIADMIHEKTDALPSSIIFETMAREDLKSPVIRFREHIAMKTLDEKNLMGLLVDMEYGGWNHVFLYVIDTMKDLNPEFHHIADQMEAHKRKVAGFMEGRPEFDHIQKRIRDMKKGWDERVLVVDDEPALVTLFKSFLEDRYEVDLAQDGQEALNKILSENYDAIILDVDLPFKTGIEICREAMEKHPDIGKRILFFTGNISLENRRFFSEHGIRYLLKPASLEAVDRRIKEILGRENAGFA